MKNVDELKYSALSIDVRPVGSKMQNVIERRQQLRAACMQHWMSFKTLSCQTEEIMDN